MALQQIVDSKGITKQQQCVAICQEQYFLNSQTKTCQPLSKCSSNYFTSTSSAANSNTVIDLKMLDIQNFLAFYPNAVQRIKADYGQLELTLSYGAQAIKSQYFNGKYYIFRTDNSIMQWEIEIDNKEIIYQIQFGISIIDSQIISINQQIGAYLTFDVLNSIIYINPIINMADNTILQKLPPLKVSFVNSSYFIQQDQIFIFSSKSLVAYSIKVDQALKITAEILLSVNYFPNSFSSIINAIYQNSQDIFLIITSNTSLIYRCKQQTCYTINLPSQPKKMIYSISFQDQFNIFIQCQSSLLLYDDQLNLIQTISISNEILDFSISYLNFSRIREIYLLSSSQQLIVYLENQKENQISFVQNQQIKVYSQQLQRLVTINQDNGIIHFLAVIGNGLQIIDKSSNSQQNQRQIISSQFQPNYVTNLGFITDILIINDQNTLATCSKEGRLVVWDTSRIYDSQYRYQYFDSKDSCLKLYKLSSNIMIALYQKSIVFLDLRSATPLKVIQKINPNPTKEFISTNKNLGILIYDGMFNCVGADSSILFSLNSPNLTQNIFNIYLDESNLLFIQYQNQMTIYQLDPTQINIADKIKVYSNYNCQTNVNVQLSKIKPLPSELYSQIGYFFEVVIFDTRASFYIFDDKFNILQQINQVPLISAVDFNFLISSPLDPNYFVMGFTTQQTAAFKFQVYNIQKGLNICNLAAFIVQGAYLMEPRKVPNKPGQYDLEIVIPLSFFTANNVFRYDTNVAANVFQMGKQIQNEIQTIYKTVPDLSYNYFGGQSGFVGISPLNTDYIKQVFSVPSSDITNVQQSYILGVYFVISKKIQIVNIHTNQLIEEIIFNDKTQESVQGFQIFTELKIIIAFKSTQMILKNFQSGQTYSYTNINNLSYYNLERENKLITLFGSKAVKLQLDLTDYQQLNAINFQSNYVVGCILSSINYYCKFQDGSFSVITQNKLNILNTIQNKFLGTNFNFQLDEKNNQLYLFTTSIYVYDLQGIFQLQLTQNNGIISIFTICGNDISYVTASSVTVMSRGTLTVRTVISSPGGGNILQLMYLPNQNHILFFTTQMRFGQIFVYSLTTLLQVTSIKNTYTQNPLSLTCAMVYDIFQNYLVYIDLTGNILFMQYTGAYSMINFLKMNQFDDGFSAPLGLSLDFDKNSILVYSSSSIYQIPYSSINLLYSRVINYPKNQYFALNSETSSEQFCVVGTQNILYNYKNNEFQSFNYFDEEDQLTSVSYIPNQQILIVAFTQQIHIYQQFSSDNLSLSNKIVITQYKLKELMTPSIFLTFDNQLIDYDFFKNTENDKIQWGIDKSITSNLCLESISLIVLGFSSGDILLYNYQEKNKVWINIGLAPIVFIEEGLNSVWVCSVIGLVQQISTSSLQPIQNFDSSKTIPQQQTDKINVFKVDVLNKRIFISLLEQYLVYVLSYTNNNLQIQQYLSFPHQEKNSIYFSNKFIIFYSTSQLNIHKRTSLEFLKSLKRENNFDQIMSIYWIQETYLIISFIRKIELFSYDYSSNSFSFLDQIVTFLPQVIKADITSSGQQLQIIGFSNNMVFENRYTIQLISSQSNQCSLSIDVQDYTSTQKQLSLIPLTTVPYYTWQNRITVTSSSSSNYFYMNMLQDDLDFMSAFSTQNSLLVIQSPTNNFANLQTIKINNSTFTLFSKQQLLLNNLKFQLIDTTNSKYGVGISFNSYIQQVYWQNIAFPNSITLSQSQFQFNNMKNIVFNSIYLNQWNLANPQRNLQQQSSSQSQIQNQNIGFFTFQNCSSVYLYGIQINNSIIEQSSFSSILFFNSINEVVLQDFYVQNLQTNIQLAVFQNVQNIVIKNLTITNSKFILSKQGNSNLSQYILQVVGCQNTTIKDSLFSSNSDMLFLITQNYYKSYSQIIYLESDLLNLMNFKLEKNNNFSQNASLAIIQISSSFNNFDQLNITKNQYNIQLQSTFQVKITNSYFRENIGINGGALSIIHNLNSIVIGNSQFLSNKATGSGGAIYLNLLTGSVKIDETNIILQNSAKIGGGVRLYSQLNSIQTFINQSIILDNQAEIYGNNFATFLQSVQISCQNYNCQFDSVKNKLTIERFNSGDTAQIFVKFLDQDGTQMRFNPLLVDSNSYPSEIIEEIKSYQLQVTVSQNSFQKVYINGENFISYNRFSKDSSAFELNNFQILSIPQTSQQININFQILPTKIHQDSNSIQNYIEADIEFRECQVGEVMKPFSKTIFSCQLCLQGTYSLASTSQIMESNEGQIQCKKCPDSATNCIGNQIQLKNNFWRLNETTDEILYCLNNPASCKQQDINSRNGCVKGYIGPLCETCDLLGDVWDGQRYTQSISSSFKCSVCSALYYQIIFIILSIIFLSLYFLVSLEIFMKNFYRSQLCHYLWYLQIIPISQSQVKDKSSLYIKILTNYIQNSSVLIQFSYYFIPTLITAVPNSLGQPTDKLVIDMQCLLDADYLKKNGTLQTISFFQSIFPIFFVVILTLVLLIAFLFQRKKFQKAKFFTLANILFVFFQPDQVTFLTKLLSCRQIGSARYSSQNLMLLCDDSNYKQFQKRFAAPLLVFWVGVPLIAIIALYKRRNSLNTCYTQYRYGYFTTGFKLKFYYWEFVRMYLKIGVVLLYTIYNTNQYITYLLIIMIFFGYIKLVIRLKPFQNISVSTMEVASYTVLIINVTFSIFQLEYSSILFQILQAFVHFCLLMHIIIIIIIIKISDQQNYFAKFVRCILRAILTKRYYAKLTQNNIIRFQTYLLWKKIKKNIKMIILQKAYEKVEISAAINQDASNNLNKDNIIKNASFCLQRSLRLSSNMTNVQNEMSLSLSCTNQKLKPADLDKSKVKSNFMQRIQQNFSKYKQDDQPQQICNSDSITDLEDLNDYQEKKEKDQSELQFSQFQTLSMKNANQSLFKSNKQEHQ